MKKFLSILLTIAMIASMSIVSMAAEVTIADADALVTALGNAVNDGGTVKLTDDVSLTDVSLKITGDVTLDLNGHNIYGVGNQAAASCLINNKGTLTIIGEGIVSYYAAQPDLTWALGFPAYADNTINNSGELTIGELGKEGPTIENTTVVGGASYCIDCYTGSSLTVNSGTVDGAGKLAIRMFSAGNVTIKGGTVTGSRAIWMQAAGSSGAPTMSLNISGGELIATGESGGYNLAVYTYSYGASMENTSVNISGGVLDGDVALTGGSNKAHAGNVSITGGTMNAVYSYADDTVAGSTVNVSGGTVKEGIDDVYLASNAATTSNADGSVSVIAFADEQAKNDAVTNGATVTFDVYPASAEVTIVNGDTEITGEQGEYWLPAGTYSYSVEKQGFVAASGTFTVPTDTSVSASLEPDYDSEDGFGITLAGPYDYDADDNVMEVAVNEYGEPVYFLILDDTNGGAPLSAYKTVEKMKLNAKWNDGAEFVESVSIVKKPVDLSADNNNCNEMISEFYDESGYFYFLEIVTADKDTTADADVFGTIEFNRKANKKDGNNIEKIEDCKRNVDFTLFYPNAWNKDGTGAIVDDKTEIEWDTEYVLKFDSDDEVELTFGTAENEGTFTVDASGQGKLFLKYNTDADEAIAAANAGVKMHFVNFYGINGGNVKFNRVGEFRYELEDAAAAYRVVDGALAEIEGLEVDDDEFIFNTNTLGCFVFADAELVNP